MKLKTLFNFVEKHKGFVYESFERRGPWSAIEGDLPGLACASLSSGAISLNTCTVSGTLTRSRFAKAVAPSARRPLA